MSYDIKIWTTKKPEFTDKLFADKNFRESNGSMIYESKNWQIVISEPYKVDEEDIPQEIINYLPGIQYFIELNLEPISAPTKARNVLAKISKSLAKSAHGIIVDEQEGTIETPAGIKRISNFSIPEDKALVTMEWWFADDIEFKDTGLRDFIDLVECTIPEAMPRRYGLYEPPNFKFAEQGKEHFINFMYENIDDSPVWYPSKPFEFINISIPNPIGELDSQFRFGHIEIQFYEDILKQPGWALAIKRFWLKASEIIKPFYSQMCQGDSPISAWWWNGVTRDLGFAVLLGQPYIELWPEFAVKAQKTKSGFCYIEDMENDNYTSVNLIVGETPERIAKPIKNKLPVVSLDATWEEKMVFINAFEENRKIKYPAVWPFSGSK